MVEQLLQIGDLIVQKRYIIYLQAFFNIVLVGSLTSYLYINFYGGYTIYSITDYKEIINFFLSGEFIKVGAIFFVSFLTTSIFSGILFEILNQITRNKIKSAILEAKGFKELEEFEAELQNELEHKYIKKPPRMLYVIYPYLKEIAESDEFFETMQDLEMNKHELRNSFLFVIRLVICLFFYWTGSIIGLELLILGTLISLIFLWLIIFLNQFYDLIPELLSIAFEKLEGYFKKQEQI